MKRLLNFLAVALLLTVAASCKKDDPTPQKTVAGTPKTIEGIETVYIPAGTFLMGSPESE